MNDLVCEYNTDIFTRDSKSYISRRDIDNVESDFHLCSA